MVFCGRPSRGCEECRNSRVKCDEGRPQCSRCVRLKRQCFGYREPIDLIFRDGGQALRNRPEEASSSKELASSCYESNHPRQPTEYAHQLRRRTDVSLNTKSLTSSIEDLAISHFYHKTKWSMSNEDPTLQLHMLLPSLYSTSKHQSLLCLATEATALAHFAKHRRLSTRLAQKRYLQSLVAVQDVLNDPVEVKTDQTLYAVLLLCGYETVSCNRDTALNWGRHIDGAAALFKLRFEQDLWTPISQKLFGFYRRNLVLGSMQMSQPILNIFHQSTKSICGGETSEDELLLEMMKIPDIQQSANALLSNPANIKHIEEVKELLRSASDSDHQLQTWELNLHSSWGFSSAIAINVVSETFFSPPRIHRYPNTYIARVWNFYRVSRLIINTIRIRTMIWLSNYDKTPCDVTELIKVSQNLVDDICASVSYLNDQDSSQSGWRVQHDLQKNERSRKRDAGEAEIEGRELNAGFSLIWPLHVCCSVTSISRAQRQWLLTQLLLIDARGGAQAGIVAASQIQVPSGQAEDFRFDCV